MGPDQIHRERKELQLPFEELERDFIPGDELYDAILSSIQALPSYVVEHSQNSYEIKGVRNSTAIIRFLPNYPTESISTEVAHSVEYSHLMVDITTQNPSEVEEMYEDVKELENNLAEYFDSNKELPAGRNSYSTPNTRLKGISSYLPRL